MSSNILDKIIANKKIEIENQKRECGLNQLEKLVAKKQSNCKGLFKYSLEQSSIGIIAEFKRKSPSRGWIFQDARIEEVVPYYSQYGASAISVLTDFEFFGGTLNDLEEACKLTCCPLLRKDFVVDEYQLYQAAYYGASAILLIAASLSVAEVKQFAQKAKELNMDVLLEVHNEQELGHICDNVDVVGVNNRDLTTFVTDVQISFSLAEKIPSEFIKISESGISSPQTVIDLRQVGYKGFLMGENFMKRENPGKALAEFLDQLA